MKTIAISSLLCIFLFLFPFQALSAEVLQIRSSTLLQIGDQNRTYTVQLACVEVSPLKEKDAINWIKSEVPRRKKVNLRPYGSNDGVLLARVFPIGENLDLSQGLENNNLGNSTCFDN